MSDYLPFEIQVGIIKRLPLKSVIQLRSVCKAWKSLIDGPDFIAHYSGQTQLQLLVKHHHFSRREEHFSIVDDETFPHHKVSPTVPPLVSKLQNSWIMGCCHGLLGLYGSYLEGHSDPIPGTGITVIWNLSIRKTVAVVVPNVMDNGTYGTDLGFGVCRETNDPKIVKITQANRWWDTESISCIPWQVEVFSLSTGAWRRPNGNNLPRKSITYTLSKVVVDGILYWLATDMIPIGGRSRPYKLIISFCMTSEEFKEVSLSDSLAQQQEYTLSLEKVQGFLVVIESLVMLGGYMVVWIIEDCVTKVFTKLFTINVSTSDASAFFPCGIRKTSEIVIQTEDDFGHVALVAYEPYSKHINNLGFLGKKVKFFFVSLHGNASFA